MEEFKLIPNHKEFEVSENGKVKEIATGKIKRAKIDKETGDRHIKLDDEDININELVDELFKEEEVEEEVKEEVLVKEKPMEDEVNKNMTIEVAKEDENDIENMNDTKVQHNILYKLLFN